MLPQGFRLLEHGVFPGCKAYFSDRPFTRWRIDLISVLQRSIDGHKKTESLVFKFSRPVEAEEGVGHAIRIVFFPFKDILGMVYRDHSIVVHFSLTVSRHRQLYLGRDTYTGLIDNIRIS